MLRPIISLEDFSGGCSLNPYRGSGNQVTNTFKCDTKLMPGSITFADHYSPIVDATTTWASTSPTGADGNFGVGLVGAYVAYQGQLYGTMSSNEAANQGLIFRANSGGEESVFSESVVSGANAVNFQDNMYFLTTGPTDRDIKTWDYVTSSAITTLKAGKIFTDLTVGLDDRLLAVHENKVDSYDGTTYSDDALVLLDNISVIESYGADRVVMLARNTNAGASIITVWDGFSAKPNQIVETTARINAMKYVNGYLWCFAFDGIYVLPKGGEILTKIFDWSRLDFLQGLVNQPSIAVANGRIYFGMKRNYVYSDVSGDQQDQTVRSLITGLYSMNASVENLNLVSEHLYVSNPAADDSVDAPLAVGTTGAIISTMYGLSTSTSNTITLLTTPGQRNQPYENMQMYFETLVYEAPVGGVIYQEGVGLRIHQPTVVSNGDDNSSFTINIYIRKNELVARQEGGSSNWTLIATQAVQGDTTAGDYELKDDYFFVHSETSMRKVQYKVEITDFNGRPPNQPFINHFYVVGQVNEDER